MPPSHREGSTTITFAPRIRRTQRRRDAARRCAVDAHISFYRIRGEQARIKDTRSECRGGMKEVSASGWHAWCGYDGSH
jgi:hypothetical protein